MEEHVNVIQSRIKRERKEDLLGLEFSQDEHVSCHDF